MRRSIATSGRIAARAASSTGCCVARGTQFFFVTPYHAWERGTNENTNGLIRQYLPKGQSLAGRTQPDCARIGMNLKMDYRAGDASRLQSKVDAVEKIVGRKLST